MDGIETLKTLLSQIENDQKSGNIASYNEDLETLSLLVGQLQKPSLSSESFNEERENTIESVGEADKPIEYPVGPITQKIDPELVKGKYITHGKHLPSSKICSLKPDMLDLLRQELYIQRNTISFKNFMTQIKLRQINGDSEVVQEIDYKDGIFDKGLLSSSVISAHSPMHSFAQKTKEEVEKIKSNLSVILNENIKKLIESSNTNAYEEKESIKAL